MDESKWIAEITGLADQLQKIRDRYYEENNPKENEQLQSFYIILGLFDEAIDKMQELKTRIRFAIADDGEPISDDEDLPF